MLLSNVQLAGKSIGHPEIMALVNGFSAVGMGIQQESHHTHTHTHRHGYTHTVIHTQGIQMKERYYIFSPLSAFSHSETATHRVTMACKR